MPPKTKPKAIGGKQGETDDSICDVVAPNVVPAREGFLAFTVSKSANVAIPASVAVTPEKPHPRLEHQVIPEPTSLSRSQALSSASMKQRRLPLTSSRKSKCSIPAYQTS